MTENHKSQTVLVTGASSFLGMHLAMSLSERFNVVATISKEASEPIRIERLALLKKNNIKIITLDVTKSDQVVSVAREYRPTYWFNHAGWVKDYASVDYDGAYADQVHLNCLPNLFSVLKEIGAKGFIGSGTSMEYSDLESAHQENEECHPSTPYGQAKLRQTQLSLELGQKYNINTAIVRIFIPYGELDSPNKMMPALMKNLVKGEKFPLSNGSQMRSFISVEKLMEIYLGIVSKMELGLIRSEIYNGAFDQGITLKQFILNEVKNKSLDVNLLQFGALPMRSSEVPFSFADTAKVSKLLGEGC